MHAPSSQLERPEFWKDLRRNLPSQDTLWLVLGDLNTVAGPSEKQGGRPFNINLCMDYFEWVHFASLIDLGFTGAGYTWKTGKEEEENIKEGPNRALANPSWLQVYPKKQVLHLPRIFSDHYPLMVELRPKTHCQCSLPRGLAAWTSHPDFENFFRSIWDPEGSPITNVNRFMEKAKDWHKNVFGNINLKKKRTKARLDGIQKALAIKPNTIWRSWKKGLYFTIIIYLRLRKVYGLNEPGWIVGFTRI